jgi:hypothetical protein
MARTNLASELEEGRSGVDNWHSYIFENHLSSLIKSNNTFPLPVCLSLWTETVISFSFSSVKVKSALSARISSGDVYCIEYGFYKEAVFFLALLQCFLRLLALADFTQTLSNIIN